jgi:hypothetical protein
MSFLCDILFISLSFYFCRGMLLPTTNKCTHRESPASDCCEQSWNGKAMVMPSSCVLSQACISSNTVLPLRTCAVDESQLASAVLWTELIV